MSELPLDQRTDLPANLGLTLDSSRDPQATATRQAIDDRI